MIISWSLVFWLGVGPAIGHGLALGINKLHCKGTYERSAAGYLVCKEKETDK